MRFTSQSRDNWQKHTIVKSLNDADKFSLDKLRPATALFYMRFCSKKLLGCLNIFDVLQMEIMW